MATGTHSRVMVGGGRRVVVVVIGCCGCGCGCFCRWLAERVAQEYNAPRCSRTLCPNLLGHVLSHDLKKIPRRRHHHSRAV